MFQYTIRFGEPLYLLLALVLIPLWISSYRNLDALGTLRRWVVLLLRTAVVLIVVAALADAKWMKRSDTVTVIYLLDQSESIPRPQREAMLQYVSEEVMRHRNAERGDRAGLIAFGGDATIEIPPFDQDIAALDQVETFLKRTDATNLEGAMKLAQASFPEDTAKRIVIVSDGNENMGNALSITSLLKDDGIGIDVVAIPLQTRDEVSVEKIVVPPQIRSGQTAEARVVLNNDGDRSVSGTLLVTRRTGNQESIISKERITIPPGKRVFGVTQTLERADMYRFRAHFQPDEGGDTLTENNEARAYAQVHGQGRVLMIMGTEDRDNGVYDTFVSRMRDQKLDITVQGDDQLFDSLADLQAYDCVILANVARANSDDNNQVTGFSDDQIRSLVKNTHDMGAGLIMLGGPNSFGAGGWTNTEMEKAMPVDFQIQNDKVQAVGALVLLMHASEMNNGNYWQKVIALEAVKTLGPMDYCGLLHWDNQSGTDDWMWGKPNGLVRVGRRRNMMVAAVNRMFPGDMPHFDPGLQKALAAFNRVNASVKHMIVISDGDPSDPSTALLNRYVKAGIKITAVAVGSHGILGTSRLEKIARITGGKYYKVNSPKALPKIYQREARRVARPLVFEPDGGVQPMMRSLHEMHQTPFKLPRLSGYVLTTTKASSLAEVSVIADKPDPNGPNSTILAAWTYGRGRTVAFTSDVTSRWSNAWQDWPDYDRFFGQMITWAMRPVNEEGEFNIATDIRDGKVRVVLHAYRKDQNYWNFLNVVGSVIDPDLKSRELRIRQVAPGRYVGEFDANKTGNYLVSLLPGPNLKPIRAGVVVPYSAEYRDRDTNRVLLEALAGLQPRGGEKGELIESEVTLASIRNLTELDTFRATLPKATSLQDAWPAFLVIAACAFLADIVVRRVMFSYEWVAPIVSWINTRLLRRVEPQQDHRMERLQKIKTHASQELNQRRESARFEPEIDAGTEPLDDVLADVQQASRSSREERPSTPPAVSGSGPGAQPESDTDYTARLLKAKKKAWNEEESGS